VVNDESTKNTDLDDDDDDDDVVTDSEDTVVLTEVDADDDDLSETVAGLNVDALVSIIEKSDSGELAKKRAARKRLEELREQLDEDDEFGSTYTFDLDDDLST
jgi:hypothetical protein